MKITRGLKEETIEELKRLLNKRKNISNDLARALSYGDLPENSAFDAARERWILNERRIFELQNILKKGRLIELDKTDRIRLGSKIIIEVDKMQKEYQVVDTIEADPVKKKISTDSPIGRALIGRKRGETITVKMQNGVKKIKILSVA